MSGMYVTKAERGYIANGIISSKPDNEKQSRGPRLDAGRERRPTERTRGGGRPSWPLSDLGGDHGRLSLTSLSIREGKRSYGERYGLAMQTR